MGGRGGGVEREWITGWGMGDRGMEEEYEEKWELGEKDLLTGWNVDFHEREDTGLMGLGMGTLLAEKEGLGCGNIPERRTSNRRRHASITWRGPRAPGSKRGPFQAKMSVWVDVGGGGGKGLDQKVAVMEGHMESIPPHVILPDERLREFSAEGESSLAG